MNCYSFLPKVHLAYCFVEFTCGTTSIFCTDVYYLVLDDKSEVTTVALLNVPELNPT